MFFRKPIPAPTPAPFRFEDDEDAREMLALHVQVWFFAAADEALKAANAQQFWLPTVWPTWPDIFDPVAFDAVLASLGPNYAAARGTGPRQERADPRLYFEIEFYCGAICDALATQTIERPTHH